MSERQAQPVSLNELSDLVGLLKEGQLGELLRESPCGCRSGSGCRSKSAAREELEEMSLSEMLSFRKERIAELRRQIEEAERLIAEAEPDSAER
ncbi:hypothetical protein GCM10010273_09710 [Streptomyces lavendulocolor]